MMGLGGFRDAESVSPVTSNITCICDCQTAYKWLLRARWTAVIDLDLIDSFSIVENASQPKASDAQKLFLKQWNAGG